VEKMENKFAYETLPYSNAVFSLTHPDKLCSLARLFGLEAPNVENARVLELGCGNGMNLITQAFYYPEAKFVGIDLAKNHIDYASESARKLNLSNIEFRQCDLLEVREEDFGKFDYITAHGLICWVPDSVREKTFSIYREMLTEKGVGYISYNVYPGWHTRQMMREISNIHTRKFDQPLEKIQNAISFGVFLAENSIGDELYKKTLQEEVTRYFSSEPPKLFHDNLAEINKPYYFHEFAEKLNEYGFQFLAEAQHFTMSTHDYPPEAKEFVEGLDNLIEREQYIDLLTGRTFRQTLFCRQEINLNHDPEPDILDSFYLSSRLTPVSPDVNLLSSDPEKFADAYQDEAIEINFPLIKIALAILTQEWGNSVECRNLLNSSKQIIENKGITNVDWEDGFEKAKQIFLQIILTSELIEIHTSRSEINTQLTEKPKINELIKWQLEEGEAFSTQYERTVKIQEPLLKALIGLLDGNHTREALQLELTEFVKNNEEIENKEKILNTLAENIEHNLNHFAKRGFLSVNSD
jgi:SAM-dependent methyltransferase